MKVFIIRHGDTLKKDEVVLSDMGVNQAVNTGKWLRNYFSENKTDLSNTIIFFSPLTRTRQTEELINSTMCIMQEKPLENLKEQEYGLFEGLTAQEQKILYPNFYEEYIKIKKDKGRFWARFPEGESPQDVCERMNDIVEEIKKTSEKKNVIIISHATAIKCFLLRWFNYSIEWYQSEPIPDNCSVRLIDKDNDYGYIYKP